MLRALRFSLGILLVAIVGTVAIEMYPGILLRFLPPPDTREDVIVVAHRGASLCAPQNTMAAFRKGVELGANGVEMDIQFTQDDVPVVAHPSTARAGELDHADLAGIDAREGERIPLLSEVLAFFRPHVASGRVERLYLHDKRENDYSGARVRRIEIFASHIREAGLRDHAVVMVESGDVTLWQRMAPDIQVLQNWSGPAWHPRRRPLEEAAGLGLEHFGVYHWPPYQLRLAPAVTGIWPPSPVMEEYQAAGADFVVFTVNDPLLMRLYLDAGYDAIGTDDVLQLRQMAAGEPLRPGLCEAAAP